MRIECLIVLLLLFGIGCKSVKKNNVIMDPYQRIYELNKFSNITIEQNGLDVSVEILDSLPLGFTKTIVNNCTDFKKCLLFNNQSFSITDPDGNIYNIPERQSSECREKFGYGDTYKTSVQFTGALIRTQKPDGFKDGIYTIENTCRIDSCYYIITSQFYYEKLTFYQLGYNLGL